MDHTNEDHNRIHFPILSSELTAALGAIEDMADGTDAVPDSVVRGRPPAIFRAGGPMLKQFDQSTASSRKGSQAPTPPRSVVGIGNKVAKPDYSEAKIVLAMVGLPARGKSYLSNKLMRYLKWLEYDVQVFNVGQLRRSRAHHKAQQSGILEDHTSSYFSHNNVEATKLREQLAEDSLEMLIRWLKKGGNVAIHDATNSTRMRRAKISARVAKEKGMSVSSGDPDYKDLPREWLNANFLRRIKEYEAVAIAFYLMNYMVSPRNIFLSRHGESQYNVEGRIGGDSLLSERGLAYAHALPELVRNNIGDAPLIVWTSTLQRTIQTAGELPYPKLTWKSLDELDAGVCDGMTYEEIEQAYPEDFANRDEDKFNYRYRGGESYRDVVVRLEPVIMELERQENILIFGHQAILRCLYAYFHDLPQADLP
ncbi:bifunctional 6-phosphofructo-2-kinase/fructose-2,6-bisphosphate 2-phosphatase [Suillus occidentalis]|nr:bifunctional 6-phosphofructo-2-kinase/fructose-2,6-bisphosphate 2-phosphatase [Suillus occidentalis]